MKRLLLIVLPLLLIIGCSKQVKTYTLGEVQTSLKGKTSEEVIKLLGKPTRVKNVTKILYNKVFWYLHGKGELEVKVIEPVTDKSVNFQVLFQNDKVFEILKL